MKQTTKELIFYVTICLGILHLNLFVRDIISANQRLTQSLLVFFAALPLKYFLQHLEYMNIYYSFFNQFHNHPDPK